MYYKGWGSLVFLGIFLLFCSNSVKGQVVGSSSNDRDESKSTATFSGFKKLSLPGNYDNFFYMDELGIRLADQLVYFESPINQTTYKLGPKDMLTIDVNGSISMLLRGMVLNSQGDLIIPSIGTINLSGLTIDSAEKKLAYHFNGTYKKTSVDLTLDKPRSIQVHITGDINNPGKYTFPAQTRVSEVIKQIIGKTLSPSTMATDSVSSRNPQTESEDNSLSRNYLNNESYSIRNIVIQHQDGTTDTADIISYFATGNLDDNPYLQSGDRLNLYKLTKWTPRVSISGAVVSPIEAEYNTNDSLKNFIQMGGGFSSDADTSKIFVFRKFDQNVHRVTVKSSNFDNFALKPNDRIIVPVDQGKQSTQSAKIHGEVNNPGEYPVIDGSTTAYDLLQMAGGITNDALPQGAFLTRDTETMQDEDKQEENPTLLNPHLLRRTSIQTREGFEYLTLEANLSEGKVGINLTNKDQLKQLNIYDGDRLYVPKDNQSVFVFGQVNEPGYYSFHDKLKVRDYIDKAGGFTLPADSNEVFIVKAGSRSWHNPSNTDIESGDMIFVNRTPYKYFTDIKSFELQEKQLRNDTIQLILAGVSTITGFITTYLVLTQ